MAIMIQIFVCLIILISFYMIQDLIPEVSTGNCSTEFRPPNEHLRGERKVSLNNECTVPC